MMTLKEFLKEQDIKATELYVNCMETEVSQSRISMTFKLDLYVEKPLTCRCGGTAVITESGISIYCSACDITLSCNTKRKVIKNWNKVMK